MVENNTKVKIYNTVIQPILTYGCESWASQQKHLSKVNAVEMKVLRRISGKIRLDRERNEVIRTNLHQKPITEKVAEKQLKWYGHVRRMDETKKPKQYMEARPEGRRQRTTYADVIEQLGRKRGKTMKEMEKLSLDRKEWKQLTRAHPTP